MGMRPPTLIRAAWLGQGIRLMGQSSAFLGQLSRGYFYLSCFLGKLKLEAKKTLAALGTSFQLQLHQHVSVLDGRYLSYILTSSRPLLS